MTVENGVRVFAGIMIWISLALTLLVHPLFWLFTAFIGLNLIQSAFTGICPATAGCDFDSLKRHKPEG